jgi:alpha,alpha-trehalose phosphorylase
VSAVIRTEGVTVFDGAVRWLRWLLDAGFRAAVVSSSRNVSLVLQVAGLSDLFEAQIDGLVRDELDLAGKPAPDTFLEGARRIGAPPERCVVVEDALVGVEAGRAGGFGLVIGVSQPGDGAGLLAHGADVVVDDLGILVP